MSMVETIYMPSENGIRGKTKKLNGMQNGSKVSNGCHKQSKQPEDPDSEKAWEKDFCESFEETPMLAAISTYIGYLILVAVGHVREFLKSIGLGVVKCVAEPKIPVSFLSACPTCQMYICQIDGSLCNLLLSKYNFRFPILQID